MKYKWALYLLRTTSPSGDPSDFVATLFDGGQRKRAECASISFLRWNDQYISSHNVADPYASSSIYI